MNKYDAHTHCDIQSLHILKNALECSEFTGALVFPFVGQSHAIYEENLKQGISNLKFAYSLKNKYNSKSDYKNELNILNQSINQFVAIKLYKDFFFNGFWIENTHYYIWDDVALPFFEIAQNKQIPIIIHCADPNDFWLQNPIYRANQMKRNPEFHHYNKNILQKSKQLFYRDFLVKKYPHVEFCFAHLGGFPQQNSEFRRNVSGHFYVDTSASIEEVLLINGAKNTAKIIADNKSRILFGSDLIVTSVKNGNDKIMTVEAINHLKQSFDMFIGVGTTKSPNYIELRWDLEKMNLHNDIIEDIFYNNYMRLFS